MLPTMQGAPPTTMWRDEAATLTLPDGTVVGAAWCRLRRIPQLRGGPDEVEIRLTAIRWAPDYRAPSWWETPTYVLRFADGTGIEGFFARWPAGGDARAEHRFYANPRR